MRLLKQKVLEVRTWHICWQETNATLTGWRQSRSKKVIRLVLKLFFSPFSLQLNSPNIILPAPLLFLFSSFASLIWTPCL